MTISDLLALHSYRPCMLKQAVVL